MMKGHRIWGVHKGRDLPVLLQAWPGELVLICPTREAPKARDPNMDSKAIASLL